MNIINLKVLSSVQAGKAPGVKKFNVENKRD